MNQYSTYKPSGIDWLGEIPEHWKLKRMKNICEYISRGITPTYAESSLYRVINQATFSKGFFDDENAKYTTNSDKKALAKNQDILIASTGGGVLGKAFFIENIKGDFYTDSHVTTIRVNKKHLITKYLYYFFSINYDLINGILAKGSTNQTELQRDQLLNFHWCTPPLFEQSIIINYLDTKTANIDRKIELLSAKADKYKALRCSLINETVCRGLNHHAVLKDSGVECIGMIPEQWDVKRVKEVFKNTGSGTTPPSGDESYYGNNGINWLQTGDLNDSFITETSKKVSQKAKDEFSTLKLYPQGSLVIAMYGATIGKMGYLNIKTTTNQACCVLSNLFLCNKMYVFYQLLSMKQYIISLSTGGGQPNINQDIIRFLKLAIPPLSEQTVIANYLDDKTVQLDTIISNIEQQINKLTQLRKTLINDVVTGKINVTKG